MGRGGSEGGGEGVRGGSEGGVREQGGGTCNNNQLIVLS